jgi:hypothetical protein
MKGQIDGMFVEFTAGIANFSSNAFKLWQFPTSSKVRHVTWLDYRGNFQCDSNRKTLSVVPTTWPQPPQLPEQLP